MGNWNPFDTHGCVQPHVEGASITLAVLVFLTTPELAKHALTPRKWVSQSLVSKRKKDGLALYLGLIDVLVKNGKVSLSGTVGTVAEKSRAYFDAWVAGVTSVDDRQLDVEAWAYDKNKRNRRYVPKSEAEIQDVVEETFSYDPRIKNSNVLVYVDGNTVTLRGNADNLIAKRAAGQDARTTTGVFVVHNHIKVTPSAVRHKKIG